LLQKPGNGFVIPEPLGVVLIFGAWNYPLDLILNPLVGAIGAGNAVILKPSEKAKHCASILDELIPKYLDNDSFKVVLGGEPQSTSLLTFKFDHIFYTGGGNIGKVIMRAAAEQLTPVTIELGGKSPVIVDENVNIDVAAKRILWGKLMNAGQICIAPDYVLIHKSQEKKFVEKLKKLIQTFYGDNPKDSKDYGRIINEQHVDRLSGLLEGQHNNIIYGGDIDRENRYFPPTLVLNPSPDSRLMQDEIFGPILPIITIDNIDEAITFINNKPKPLALYIFTKNKKISEHVINSTSSGAVSINEVIMHYTCTELPFGGVGDSGIGSYHGKYSFDNFTHYKPVLDKSTVIDPDIRYPPYHDNKIKWLLRLMDFKLPTTSLYLFFFVILVTIAILLQSFILH